MDKLQELTQRLYDEGLSKGRQEGEAILENAHKEAERIIAEARKEAEAILTKADRDAADHRTRVEGDVKMASTQAIQSTRTSIENLVVSSLTDAEVSKNLADPAFIKDVITAVAKNFSAQESCDLSLVLPESMKESLEPFILKELPLIIGKGVDVSFSGRIAGGFRIAPKDGGYFISLTDETFRELIGGYLRPATRKILFGE